MLEKVRTNKDNEDNMVENVSSGVKDNPKIILKIKEKLYIIIPLLCILFWAIISLIKDNFVLEEAIDFSSFYFAGKNIFIHPELIYTAAYPKYYYLPNFASFFSIISLFDYVVACWVYFFILLILAWSSIIEFNKILKLKKVDNSLNRFLILFALSNGLVYMYIFDVLQSKFFAMFLMILFIRREIQYRNISRTRKENSKFLFIQFSILIFSISVIPFIFYIIPLYIFNEMKIKEIFKKSQIEKYLIFLLSFFLQNFMFIISPGLIIEFIRGGINIPNYVALNLTPEYILAQRGKLPNPPNFISSLIMILNISIDFFIVSIITHVLSIIVVLILIFNKKLSLEKKIAYYFLFTMIFSIYFVLEQAFVIFLPFITLYFINLKTKPNILDFLKENYLHLIGLSCILLLLIMPPIYLFYEILPFTLLIPLPILIMRYSVTYTILTITILLVKKKENKYLNLNKV